MSQVVTTTTVNQWAVKRNAEKGEGEEREPVICVNSYSHRNPDGTWGDRVAAPQHFHSIDVPNSTVVYDPVNKAPCGASCWMQVAGFIKQ